MWVGLAGGAIMALALLNVKKLNIKSNYGEDLQGRQVGSMNEA